MIATKSEVLPEVAPLRQASREVVRELGMLEDTFSPASVTHTQCHALVELERHGVLGVSELAAILRLDKSAVSRAIGPLLERKLVTMKTPADDRRRRVLGLSAAGRRLVARVHVAADARVDDALRQLGDGDRAAVVEGMRIYARALQRARVQARVKIRPITSADDAVVAEIIRTVMTEHGASGPGFAIHDPEVARMSAHYDPRARPPAIYFVLDDAGIVVGGAGFAPLAAGDARTCELRKMYLRPQTRGSGLGRRLLAHVLEAARQAGYVRCYLETMATMLRARALYESVGFRKLPAPEGATGHFGCDAWYARDLRV
jgi:putative acetyltransferase